MQRRIDYETEMAGRASASDEALENQDFGEFVEDRFMEMYGIKKVAHENLRDFVKTLKDCSGNHIRLKTFPFSLASCLAMMQLITVSPMTVRLSTASRCA